MTPIFVKRYRDNTQTSPTHLYVTCKTVKVNFKQGLLTGKVPTKLNENIVLAKTTTKNQRKNLKNTARRPCSQLVVKLSKEVSLMKLLVFSNYLIAP